MLKLIMLIFSVNDILEAQLFVRWWMMIQSLHFIQLTFIREIVAV
jgi:hypothetical protein